MIAEFVSIYQNARSPNPSFFDVWDAEEPILVTKLKERPIALAYIENLFSAFRAKMLKAL